VDLGYIGDYGVVKGVKGVTDNEFQLISSYKHLSGIRRNE
jgi:hypothetical protein